MTKKEDIKQFTRGFLLFLSGFVIGFYINDAPNWVIFPVLLIVAIVIVALEDEIKDLIFNKKGAKND